MRRPSQLGVEQRRWTSSLSAGLAIVLILAGLATWLGFQAQRSRQVAQIEATFVQFAKQGALNLANIRSGTVEDDVNRVVQSSTDPFLTDFQHRAPAFIDFVKQADSRSEAQVREAALESVDGTRAQVMVALRVKVSTAGAPAGEQPRSWRMRITIQKDSAGNMKMSDVEFVP